MSSWRSSVAVSRIRRQLLGVALAASALLLQGSLPSPLPQGGFSVGNYRRASKVKRIDAPGVELYRAQLTNSGAAVSAARAKVVSLTPEIVILEDTLVFQPVPAGASVTSLDTFSILRLGRAFPSSATLAWTVEPNQPPEVDAGPDLVVDPTSAAVLAGEALDDELPVPPALTLEWTQVSGPGTASFVDSTSATTSATFTQPGA